MSIRSGSSAGVGPWRALLGICAVFFPLIRNIFGLDAFSGADFTKGLNAWTSLILVVAGVFQQAGQSGYQQWRGYKRLPRKLTVSADGDQKKHLGWGGGNKNLVALQIRCSE